MFILSSSHVPKELSYSFLPIYHYILFTTTFILRTRNLCLDKSSYNINYTRTLFMYVY